ncbi:hypothetical protein B7755_043800 [Streptomyces sp. NBS 14/10]|nr:hypothetical protein [Streptomyces sp. NBS 14/10]KAK1184419.1 hypothetical protein B7755_043800 [Streptomyces sp. NBS 14/10]
MTTAPATYWERLWSDGRRYRQVTGAETTLLANHLGPGGRRPGPRHR